MINLNTDLVSLKTKYDEIKEQYQLGLLAKDDYYSILNKIVNDNKKLIDNSIFKFFGNDLFIACNADKKFSLEEMALIITNSNNILLNEKIDTLKQILDSTNNKDLKEYINNWINSKQYFIDYCYKLNNSKIVFMISKANQKLYSNFNDLLKSEELSFYNEVTIEAIDNNGTVGRIYFAKEEDYKSINNPQDRIIDIFISKKIKNIDAQFIEQQLIKLDTKVDLDHPFLKYDSITIENTRYQYYIVADNKDIKNNTYNSDWVKLSLPYYYIETSPFNDEVKQGDVNVAMANVYCSLDGIKLLSKFDMTFEQYINIEKIKMEV